MNNLNDEVALTTLFNQISDGSKTIDARCGVEIVYKLGLVPSKEDINEFIDATNGKCTLTRLKQFCDKLKYAENNSVDDLIEIFQTQDTEGKGTIPKNEFKKLFSTVGSALVDDELDIIISAFGGDSENINYRDFINNILNQQYDK